MFIYSLAVSNKALFKEAYLLGIESTILPVPMLLLTPTFIVLCASAIPTRCFTMNLSHCQVACPGTFL